MSNRSVGFRDAEDALKEHLEHENDIMGMMYRDRTDLREKYQATSVHELGSHLNELLNKGLFLEKRFDVFLPHRVILR